jgi:hypothetical protein
MAAEQTGRPPAKRTPAKPAGRKLAVDTYVVDPESRQSVLLEAGTAPDARFADQLGEHLFVEPSE